MAQLPFRNKTSSSNSFILHCNCRIQTTCLSSSICRLRHSEFSKASNAALHVNARSVPRITGSTCCMVFGGVWRCFTSIYICHENVCYNIRHSSYQSATFFHAESTANYIHLPLADMARFLISPVHIGQKDSLFAHRILPKVLRSAKLIGPLKHTEIDTDKFIFRRAHGCKSVPILWRRRRWRCILASSIARVCWPGRPLSWSESPRARCVACSYTDRCGALVCPE